MPTRVDVPPVWETSTHSMRRMGRDAIGTAPGRADCTLSSAKAAALAMPFIVLMIAKFWAFSADTTHSRKIVCSFSSKFSLGICADTA